MGLSASLQKFAYSFHFSFLISLEKPLLAATRRDKFPSLWFLRKRENETFTSLLSFSASLFHQVALRSDALHGWTGCDLFSTFKMYVCMYGFIRVVITIQVLGS